MVMAEIAAGIQALVGLRTIAGGLVGLHDLSLLGGIQTEMNGKILDAQAAMLTLQATLSTQRDEIDSLKSELAEFKRKASERERYELYPLRPGAFVYKLRDGVDPPEAMHYLCQPCFDKGVKAVLERGMTGDKRWMESCPICEHYLTDLPK
jgi:hypothetical protein